MRGDEKERTRNQEHAREGSERVAKHAPHGRVPSHPDGADVRARTPLYAECDNWASTTTAILSLSDRSDRCFRVVARGLPS